MSTHEDPEVNRLRLKINGIVQGVGFRPFIYRMAKSLQITGFVRNQSDGVLIEIEGHRKSIEKFKRKIKEDLPPLAQISHLSVTCIEPAGDTEFKIQSSVKHHSADTQISPDIATCEDCLREMFDQKDRRFGYPFLNCTNCGPRFTILKRIPYDRSNTSMSRFELCDACLAEYQDPFNRRFHAQPNACPDCGPKITLHDRDGLPIATDEPVQYVRESLLKGRIAAIKGLGGFHLAVDPRNRQSVRELRIRKGRNRKPFALMADQISSVKKHCKVSPDEESALTSIRRPIVLLERLDPNSLAPEIAPGNRCLGFMLPYTPLHFLLLRDDLDVLVMTSGNIAEEPIAIANEEALRRLSGVADFFVFHNREILQRCDDSVIRVFDGKEQLIRRARGYVPVPIQLPGELDQPVLACGGELKNTVAVSYSGSAYLSQHIGNLDNPSAFEFFQHCGEMLAGLLEVEPRIVACDLHPEYLSTKWALNQDMSRQIGVQHHHAHLAAVMAENSVSDQCIGIILDGTGYGMDQTIWGGEVLTGDFKGFERLAWIGPFLLPGGEAAVRQPWRTALSLLHLSYGNDLRNLKLPLLERIPARRQENLLKMIDQQINSPLTSSCGRLFDGVSAILDICLESAYEAQAAIELESIADYGENQFYSSVVERIDSLGNWNPSALIRAIVDEMHQTVPVGKIAARFHCTLAEVFSVLAQEARLKTGISTVGLSGGCFQNALFLRLLKNRLEENGFSVLIHSRVPTNDGGLSYGQAAVALARLDQD
jgi:hydrogenase maturation protein HypF